MEKAGEIEEIICHPRFSIVINDKKICSVNLDFSYFLIKRQETIYEDVKSEATATPISRLKKKLCEATHHIEIDWVY